MRLGLPALAALALTLPAAAQSISSAVNEAIDRGAVRLMQLQAGNGSWSQSGYHGSYPMGATAFTAYTLRKSGLPANHDALKRAQSFLAERRPQKSPAAKQLAPARARRAGASAAAILRLPMHLFAGAPVSGP